MLEKHIDPMLEKHIDLLEKHKSPIKLEVNVAIKKKLYDGLILLPKGHKIPHIILSRV
jgi:hypothetical protein